MSYSRVTVNIPTKMIQTNPLGITPDIQAAFLPMSAITNNSQTLDPSLSIYKGKLEPYNFQMMQWLQTPEHAMQFYQDPLAAFREAVNPPDELLSMITKERESFPASEDLVIPQLNQELSDQLTTQLKDVTEGWDIVVAMRQDAINQSLKYAYDKSLFPHSFIGEYTILGIIKAKISAKLASLSMVGGTGSCITLALNFSEVTITVGSDTSYTIRNLIVKLSMNLRKIKSSMHQTHGTRYDFILDIADTEAFVGIALENLPPDIGIDPATLEITILATLRDHFSGKEYRLFSADVNGMSDIEFLIPSEIEYAGQSDSQHLPTIGALLKTKDGNKGAEQLNVNLFPEKQSGKPDSNAVMAMSRDLFLKNVGITALANAFQVRAKTFAYHSSNHYVYNTAPFNYYEKVKGYTVNIKKALLKIENGKLTLELVAHIEPSAGLYIDYTVYAPYHVSIIDKSGKQSVHFELDRDNYRESHDVSAEWWVWLISFLALLVGSIVLVIILAVINSTAPTIGADTFATAIHDVDWNHLNIVKLNTIELGDCIRIGCTAEFKA